MSYVLAKNSNNNTPKDKFRDKQENKTSDSRFVISPEEKYYDENASESINTGVIEPPTSADSFANLQNYDAVCIPRNVDELFKAFDANSFNQSSNNQKPTYEPCAGDTLATEKLAVQSPKVRTLDAQTTYIKATGSQIPDQFTDTMSTNAKLTDTKEIPPKMKNYGSIILNEQALTNVDNTMPHGGGVLNKVQQEQMDKILAHALDPGAYGNFAHSSAYSGFSTRKNRSKKSYTNLQSTDGNTKEYLAQIMLPDDSLLEPNLRVSTSTDLPIELPHPFFTERPVIQSGKLPHSFLESADYSEFLSIEFMLQIPCREEANLEGSCHSLTEDDTDSDACALPKYERIETDFFSFYDEKERAQDNIMWDTSHDSIEICGDRVFDESMDCWADFDLETDWIDITFYLGEDYTFEVVNENHGSTIVIKNTGGTIVQGMTISNCEASYPLIYAMQEHIKNPLIDDILSLGARFGIFAIDNKEPWFSSLREQPNITEFFVSQQRLRDIQEKYHLKCVKAKGVK